VGSYGGSLMNWVRPIAFDLGRRHLCVSIAGAISLLAVRPCDAAAKRPLETLEADEFEIVNGWVLHRRDIAVGK
jgi:hypothetical protein